MYVCANELFNIGFLYEICSFDKFMLNMQIRPILPKIDFENLFM